MSRVIRVFLVLIILTVVVGGGYLYYTQSLPGGTNSWFSFMSSDDANDKQIENPKTLGFQANIVEVGKEAFDFKNLLAQNSGGNQKSSSSPSSPEAPTNPAPTRDSVTLTDPAMGGSALSYPAPEDYNSQPYEFQIQGTLPSVGTELAVYQKQVSKEFQETSLDLSQIIQLRSKKLQNVSIQDGEYSVSLDFAMGNLGIYRNYNEAENLENVKKQEAGELISEAQARVAAQEFLNRFGIDTSGLEGPNVQEPQKSGGCPPNAMCLMREGDAAAGSTGSGMAPTPAVTPALPEPDVMKDDDASSSSEDLKNDDQPTTDASETLVADKMIWPGPVGYGPYVINYHMKVDGQKVLNQWDQSEMNILNISVNSASGEVEHLNGWIAAVTFQKSAYPTISSDEIMSILKKGGLSPSQYWGEKKDLEPIVFNEFQIGLVEYADWQNQSTYYIPTFFAKADNPNSTNEWDKTMTVSIPLISRKYLPFLPDYGNGGGVPIPLMEKRPL